jgi:transposase
MRRPAYPTDVSDAQWALIAPWIPPALPGGRPRTTNMRQVVNAILYVLRTGCAWRLLPHDLPPWSTVYDYFRKFRLNGLWQRLHEALRDRLRRGEGREASPSAAILDSQSVKTTEKGGLGDTTRERRSTGANATSSLTPWASSWPSPSTKRTCRTATEPSGCWNA